MYVDTLCVHPAEEFKLGTTFSRRLNSNISGMLKVNFTIPNGANIYPLQTGTIAIQEVIFNNNNINNNTPRNVCVLV